eukprot:NODE_8044_length_374_cov_218.572308_g6317_i0.p1 GENE.NODE_8044_length_374_cov_218.572308_g6317_i0~~NODE_8044_length_374_cov_218.572308_g6317_i0.p1  ORF type:complete len:79 (+),score=18.91 NODE_8044_length_374_cov_218.572308_g6317_i0:123-359(+)
MTKGQRVVSDGLGQKEEYIYAPSPCSGIRDDGQHLALAEDMVLDVVSLQRRAAVLGKHDTVALLEGHRVLLGAPCTLR